jgi:hypothetical protein
MPGRFEAQIDHLLGIREHSRRQYQRRVGGVRHWTGRL